MQIAVKDLDPVQNYHLLIQTVLPPAHCLDLNGQCQ